MKSSLPVTTAATKAERRTGNRFSSHYNSSSSAPSSTIKPSLLLAFLSCFAWLYVAGRLWQDAENRSISVNLLENNLKQRPKVLTVEDKLVVLGCKDLEKRISEVKMDLTLAKSQGYLRNQLKENGSTEKKFLAVIGVYTGFGSRFKRNTFRGSWMPKGNNLRKLEEKGIVIRFVIGRSPNRGDSLDRNIDDENRKNNDFLILEDHEEAQEELSKKAKFFFSAAVQNWDAEFYVKVDDNIDLDLDGLTGLLESKRGQPNAYIGCMKSGEVVTEEGKQWYEPDWWKFGDQKTYFRHASSSLFILSRSLAEYIFVNSVSLKSYAHDDTSVGSWMMGLQSTYIDDNRLCCSTSRQAFRYKKSEHNVFEVNKTGYENCTTEGSIGNWTNGKDFIQFKKPGRYYFICENGGCSLGMKASVVVHRLPPPSSGSVIERTGQKSDKDSNSASDGSFGW